MPLYRPSELSAFLLTLGHRPKRTLSQNFLVDGNIVAKIISELDLHLGSLVIEIGPGPGVLTEACLAKGAAVIAIEKDEGFAHALRRFDHSGTQLTVVASDVLDCSFADLVGSRAPDDVVVASNLPYHLTTPIIQKVVENSRLFSKAVLMVQDEVARRLTGGKACFLSCCVECCADVHYAFPVPRGCFWPKPKVDSAILTFHIHPSIIPRVRQKQFFDLLRTAFSHRRKTVLHSLLGNFSREILTVAFDRIGICHTSRPEELSLNRWVELLNALYMEEAFVPP